MSVVCVLLVVVGGHDCGSSCITDLTCWRLCVIVSCWFGWVVFSVCGLVLFSCLRLTFVVGNVVFVLCLLIVLVRCYNYILCCVCCVAQFWLF